MRVHTLIAGGVIAAGVFTASPAVADADHTQTLRQICEANDGTFVPTRTSGGLAARAPAPPAASTTGSGRRS